MIELSNTTAETLAAGQSITFNTTLLKTGYGECHRTGSGSVRMNNKGIYEVHFSGNITGATAGTAVELSLQIGDETLPTTTMISVPAAANDHNAVSTSVLISNCCADYGRIKVTNTGSTQLTVAANSLFWVKRVA